LDPGRLYAGRGFLLLGAALSCAPASDHPQREAPMARITIEDCMVNVPNRFHLVQMVAIRAKQLKKGAKCLVPMNENREVVTALREVAAGFVMPDYGDETTPEETAEVVTPTEG
jgi:DNA-directed RNA polymerase subunit omega